MLMTNLSMIIYCQEKNLSVYSWHSENYETNMHGYILLAMTDFACVVRVKYNTEGKENFFTHID